jgi:arginase
MSPRALHVLGVPFNSAARAGGVARAPDALRRAGLIGALDAALGVPVVDRGNVNLERGSPIRDPSSGLIAPDALAAMIRSSRAEVGSILAERGMPLVIGGDCPVLLGCLAGVGTAAPPGLLFVDGHEDAWPPRASTTGEAADMELGFLLRRAVDGLPPELVREIPRVRADRIVALGPRDAADLAGLNIRSVADEVQVVRPSAIAQNPARIGTRSAMRAGADGSWWLHVDLDVLETRSLGSVDYPQPGGLEWTELSELTRHAVAVPGLLGMDVTIYNPDLDGDGDDARLIVRYLVATLREALSGERSALPASEARS